jgi:type II secretion system protein N
MNRLTGRQIVRIIGYSGFFVVAFMFFFVACFPIERFGRLLERQLGGFLGREVTIGETDLSLTGALVLSNVEIGVPAEGGQVVEPVPASDSKKKNKDKKQPKKRRLVYTIEEVSIDLGMLALAFGELDIEVDMEAFGGTLRVDFEGPSSIFGERKAQPDLPRNARVGGDDRSGDDLDDETPMSLEVEIEGILLDRVHDLKSIFPMPITGTLNFEMALDSPTSKLADSSGQVVLSLGSLILSRKNFESEIFGMNLAVPPLVIKVLNSELVFEKGEGKVAKFDMESKHIAGTVQGGVSLKDPLSKSQLDLYLTFRPLPAYIEKSNILKTILPDIDSLSKDAKKAHRDDGSFGFRYSGTLGKSGRFIASKDYTPRSSRKARAGRAKRSRTRARTARRTRSTRPRTKFRPETSRPDDSRAKSVDARLKSASEKMEPPIREPRGSFLPPGLGAKRSTERERIKSPAPREEEETEESAEEEEATEEGSEEEAEEEAEEETEEVEEADEAEESEEAEAPEKDEDTEEE